MKNIFFLTILGLLSYTNAFAFILSDLDTPESFVVDPSDGTYYVSSINGDDLVAKDGNGYISKIDSSGNTMIQKFIGGRKEEMLLNGPKGLFISGQNIFVTDIDTVKGYDKATGKPTVLVDLSKAGAKFLNDIVGDSSGKFYVSDTLGNRIFKIDSRDGYSVSVFKEGEELGQPNGLLINPKNRNLMVTTFGTGQLLEIDRAGNIHVVKRGLTTLDGIACDPSGNIYLSSFEKGEIYKITNFGRGILTTHLSGLANPADISLDNKKDELLIPSFKGNTVSTVPLKKHPQKNPLTLKE